MNQNTHYDSSRFRTILLTVVFISFFACNKAGSPNGEINLENWTKHPSIVEVEKLYDQIELDIKSTKIMSFKKETKARPGLQGMAKIIYQDISYHVVKYTEEGIQNGSTFSRQYYYDDKQILRLGVAKISKDGKEENSLKVYFDSAGHKIWEDLRKGSLKSSSMETLVPVINPREFFDKD